MNIRRMVAILAAFLMGLANLCFAAGPRLTCDPYPPTEQVQPTDARIFQDADPTGFLIPATSGPSGKIIDYDLSSLSSGSHTFKSRWVVNDPTWGNQESADSNTVTVVRPAPPATPAGIALERVGSTVSIVCTAYAAGPGQPTDFIVTMDSGSPVTLAAQTLANGTKRLNYDVTNIAVGAHTVKVKATVNDPLWGALASPESPFTFTRPTAPRVPINTRLSP